MRNSKLLSTLLICTFLLIFQSCDDNKDEMDVDVNKFYEITYRIELSGDDIISDNPVYKYKKSDGSLVEEPLFGEDFSIKFSNFENGNEVLLDFSVTTQKSFTVKISVTGKQNGATVFLKENERTITNPSAPIKLDLSVGGCNIPCN